MKHLFLGVGVVALGIFLGGAVLAQQPVKGKVTDHYKTIYQTVKVTKPTCYQTNGNAGEGAFLGALIGGITGKAITNEDGGAAIGALFGAIVGADNAQKTKTKCVDENTYVNQEIRVYSHSSVLFYLNGIWYDLVFDKGTN
jgi:uncharacterized protein YcfJ